MFRKVALIAALCLPMQAQLDIPINQPVFRAFDQNGVPLAGGLLFSYQAGTTTPKATYTDPTGATPNANPVVLDSTGSAKIFMGTGAYKFVLQTSGGSQLWTVDQIQGTLAPALTSFNGRTGVVVPANGDYSCAMITNCPTAMTFSTRFTVAGAAVDLANVGTASTYANPTSVTVDAYGRVTAVTAGSGGSSGTPRTCNATGCYRIEADGTITEWFTGAYSSSTYNGIAVALNLPYAMPNAVQSVQVTTMTNTSGADTAEEALFTVSSFTNTSVTVFNTRNADHGGNSIAPSITVIGY